MGAVSPSLKHLFDSGEAQEFLSAEDREKITRLFGRKPPEATDGGAP